MSGICSRALTLCLLAGVLCVLAGCYQIHSDDDLRTVPVTNNPQVVPQTQAQVPVRMPNAMPY